MLYLGTRAYTHVLDKECEVIRSHPQPSNILLKHWQEREARRQMGIDQAIKNGRGLEVFLDANVPNAHMCLVGNSGGGKTSAVRLLSMGQWRAGGSSVIITFKESEFDAVCADALAAGLTPEQVTLISPRVAGACPGCNFFDQGLPVHQVAADLAALLTGGTDDQRLPRARNILLCAALAVGSHPGLSFYELIRLLTDEDFCCYLLAQPAPTAEDPFAYGEARDFLLQFLAWSRSQRAEATEAVLNKLRGLLRPPLLRGMVCARRTTLRLSRLFHEPHLLLVHLDVASLGDEGARLLAGLLTIGLFRTALRTHGPVSVQLVTDEGGFTESYMGATATQILSLGRSLNLHLILATQHFSQMSEGMRASLLTNAATLLAFRTGHADARMLAASLAHSTPVRPVRFSVSEEKERGETAAMTWRLPILDGYGRPLRLSSAVWERLPWREWSGPQALLEVCARARASGISRLYLCPTEGVPIELTRALDGLSARAYQLEGPRLSLLVTVPRLRFSGVERLSESEATRQWTQTLQELPIQHAVLSRAGRPVGVVRLADVPTHSPAGLEAYRAAAIAANGQSPQQMEKDLRERQERVWKITGRRPPASGDDAPRPPHEEGYDGSLA